MKSTWGTSSVFEEAPADAFLNQPAGREAMHWSHLWHRGRMNHVSPRGTRKDMTDPFHANPCENPLRPNHRHLFVRHPPVTTRRFA